MKFSLQLVHCDVPCGIYEPLPAKLAAMTVLKMVQQIKELERPKDTDDPDSFLQFKNSLERRIAVKEEQAQLCKNELYILWSDFFKPEHLQKFPNLHELFWQALKLCSKNKQEISESAARQLTEAVDKIAKIFYEAKNIPLNYKAYKQIA